MFSVKKAREVKLSKLLLEGGREEVGLTSSNTIKHLDFPHNFVVIFQLALCPANPALQDSPICGDGTVDASLPFIFMYVLRHRDKQPVHKR